jgi:16S rRNA (cytosine1402-N4)-methyltransferase
VTNKGNVVAGEPAHMPVMVDAILESLAPQDGDSYIDGTFGGGGYSRALLKAAECKVWGIDRDSDAVSRGTALVHQFPGRLDVIEGRFSDMVSLLSDHGITGIDGVALDLGVSSYQLQDSDRGFSFQIDGPLDMRMGKAGRTAEEVVNEEEETTLCDLIYSFGEERHARRVARAIVAERSREPIRTTGRLSDIIVDAMPRALAYRRRDIHPATRTFQALRIYVNDEIGELKRGLAAAERLLNPHGRLAVVSFHSLEDREVKRFLQKRGGLMSKTSRHRPPLPSETSAPTFELLFRGVRRPTDAEILENSRARSARLRAAIRTDAPACQEVTST